MRSIEELQALRKASGRLGGRSRARSYDVIVPTWKVAELAGITPRAVQYAISRGNLEDRRIESVFSWLIGRRFPWVQRMQTGAEITLRRDNVARILG